MRVGPSPATVGVNGSGAVHARSSIFDNPGARKFVPGTPWPWAPADQKPTTLRVVEKKEETIM